MSTSEAPKTKRRGLPVAITVVWMLIMVLVYGLRPNWATAMFVWPAWVGMVVGIILLWRVRSHQKSLFVAWLIFGFGFVDEFWSVPRGLLPEPTRDFRAVSLNCAGGSMGAAREVKLLKPDLVLFQETPSRRYLEEFATELFGPDASYVLGPDAAIVARGDLRAYDLPKWTTNFVASVWTAKGQAPIDVVSLRLAPPVMRIDLYSPSAWTDFADNRAARAKELKEVADALATMKVRPTIIGGDFNTPPDPILKPLVDGLSDAFASAGVGLGATCVNPYPCIVRIDQIWSGKTVRCVRSFVVATEFSDHRMVVADYRWTPR